MRLAMRNDRGGPVIPLYILVAKARLIDTYAALTLPFLVDAFNVFLMRQYILQLPIDLEEVSNTGNEIVLREPEGDLADRPGVVWESLWANLTFAVPD